MDLWWIYFPSVSLDSLDVLLILSFSILRVPVKYVPGWFPGATFKRTAHYFRELIPEFVDKPFETVKKERVRLCCSFNLNFKVDLRSQQAAGWAKPSLVANALENRVGEDENEDYEMDIREVAAASFAGEHNELYPMSKCTSQLLGGSDTVIALNQAKTFLYIRLVLQTRSTLQVLFLALMLHHDVQREAQEQLDKVVGRDRLPEFEDLQQCPYVRAIVMEILRWQPVVPLGESY